MSAPIERITFERFAIELRETFANCRNGPDEHWQAVARRALALSVRVDPELPAMPLAAETGV